MSDAVNSMVTYCVNDTVAGEERKLLRLSLNYGAYTKCSSCADDNLNNKQSSMPLFELFWSVHLNNYLSPCQNKRGK